MTKRGTTQPLTILVAADWLMDRRIVELRAQGHHIVTFADALAGDELDLILHPAAHLWNDMMWDYLPAAIAAARKRKREAK